MLKPDKPLKIMVVGLRGFPDIQGGIETHAQHLYPELVKLGCEVEVIVRRPYVKQPEYMYQGVRLKALWSPTKTGLEALVHSFLAVCYAGICRPDVLHIHAIGPALFVPLARLLRLKVVMTHHGMDYDRQKWGGFAKAALYMGEKLGVRYSHACITVSKHIRQQLLQMCSDKNEVIAIPNGVKIPELVMSQDILKAFSLEKKKYFLMVSRFVPEKRQDDLIVAFLASSVKDKRKLVLVGDYTNGEEGYLQKVCRLAQAHPNVVLTGFQTGDALAALYTNAESFFLPSSHEGLPIALLEALSYGLYVVVSDIPAHLEMELDRQYYFKLGDVKQLTQRIENIPNGGLNANQSGTVVSDIKERFDWSVIAEKTFNTLKQK